MFPVQAGSKTRDNALNPPDPGKGLKFMGLLFLILTMAAGAMAADMPRAKWLVNGLIDAGGSHEPYLFGSSLCGIE